MLEVDGLKVRTDEREILHGVSFLLEDGETAVLPGPNGAGKSTLAAAIAGDPRFQITDGSIRFDGEDISKSSTDKRARAGIFLMMQTPAELPGIRTDELLFSALRARGEEKTMREVRDMIRETAARLEMPADLLLKRDAGVGMSGGEKKKCETLQMLILRPKLAILDEPDSGLDVDAANVISRELARFQDETGAALLIVTHNFRILKDLRVDKTFVMAKGKITESGGAELLEKIQKEGFKKYE